MKTAYNLRESTTTKQLHIFKTKKSKISGCSDEALVSACQEININEANIIYLSCLTEEEIKTILAKSEVLLCKKCINNIDHK